MLTRRLAIVIVLGGIAVACQPSRASSPSAVVVGRASPVVSSPPPAPPPPDDPVASVPPAVASSAPPVASAPPPPAPPFDDVARVVAFIDKLPTCVSVPAAISLEQALARASTRPSQSIRGRLVPRPESYTEMLCDGDDCCNVCDGSWVLVSAEGAERATLPMGWAVRQCHVGALMARVGAGVDVVATGALRDAPGRPDGSRAVLPDAHLCVVRPVR